MSQRDDFCLVLIDVSDNLPLPACRGAEFEARVDKISATDATNECFLLDSVTVTKAVQLTGRQQHPVFVEADAEYGIGFK